MSPSGIEVVPVTAAEFGAAFLLFVLLLAVAVALTAWAVRGPAEPEPVVEPVDPANETTVEIRPRGPGRPPHTGTIHAAHLPVPDDSPTQVIRWPGAQS